MDLKPLNIGIVGYGHYVRTNFVRHIKDLPFINIVGVYNRGEERRLQAGEDGFAMFDTYEDLLALPELEAVYIGTSNSAHKEQAIKAAEAGKHIYCEKPLSLDYNEIKEIVAVTSTKDIVTHVNHTSPYTASFKKFRELVETRLGDIQHVWVRISRGYGNWLNGARHVAVEFPQDSGGWTIHHLCHALNEAVILLKNPKAKTVFHISQKSTPECPGEELVNALVLNEDGSSIQISDGTTIGGFTDLGVSGTLGDIRMLNGKITLVTHGEPNPAQRPGNRRQIIEEIDTPPSATGAKNIEGAALEFTKVVRAQGGMVFSFNDIADQYKILTAMRKSSDSGKSVDIADIN